MERRDRGAARCARSILFALLAGCAGGPSVDGSDGASSDSGTNEPCVPGQTRGCTCEDGSPGAQACRPDGGGFDACACEGGDAATTTASTTASSNATEDAGSDDASASTSSAETSGTDTGAGGDAVSDDFERAELGPSWVVVFPPPPDDDQVAIVDDSDLGMLPGPQGFFLVNWRGTGFATDQFCEATIPEGVDEGWIHQVYVRWREEDGARYGFGYGGDADQEVFESWYFKYDGVPTAQTRYIASAPSDQPPTPGTTLRIEIEGFTLRGYVDGELVLEATDTDPSRIEDGEVGLGARWAAGNQSTAAAVKVFESWSGGSL